MATINGVSIRNVKFFKDDAKNSIYNVSVYVKGKKKGNCEVNLGKHTCMCDFDDTELMERCQQFQEGMPECQISKRKKTQLYLFFFMKALIYLKLDEDIYTSSVKEGRPVVAIGDVNNMEVLHVETKDFFMEETLLLNHHALTNTTNKRIFTDPKDFTIMVNKEHHAPKYIYGYLL